MGETKILTREAVEVGADAPDRWTWVLRDEDKMRLMLAAQVNLDVGQHIAPLRAHIGDLRATCLHYMGRVEELERQLAELNSRNNRLRIALADSRWDLDV